MNKEDQLIRLQKMILNDKLRIPNGFSEILKSELSAVLGIFFVVDEDTVRLTLSADESGYSFCFSGKATDVKKVRAAR